MQKKMNESHNQHQLRSDETSGKLLLFKNEIKQNIILVKECHDLMVELLNFNLLPSSKLEEWRHWVQQHAETNPDLAQQADEYRESRRGDHATKQKIEAEYCTHLAEAVEELLDQFLEEASLINSFRTKEDVLFEGAHDALSANEQFQLLSTERKELRNAEKLRQEEAREDIARISESFKTCRQYKMTVKYKQEEKKKMLELKRQLARHCYHLDLETMKVLGFEFKTADPRKESHYISGVDNYSFKPSLLSLCHDDTLMDSTYWPNQIENSKKNATGGILYQSSDKTSVDPNYNEVTSPVSDFRTIGRRRRTTLGFSSRYSYRYDDQNESSNYSDLNSSIRHLVDRRCKTKDEHKSKKYIDDQVIEEIFELKSDDHQASARVEAAAFEISSLTVNSKTSWLFLSQPLTTTLWNKDDVPARLSNSILNTTILPEYSAYTSGEYLAVIKTDFEKNEKGSKLIQDVASMASQFTHLELMGNQQIPNAQAITSMEQSEKSSPKDKSINQRPSETQKLKEREVKSRSRLERKIRRKAPPHQTP